MYNFNIVGKIFPFLSDVFLVKSIVLPNDEKSYIKHILISNHMHWVYTTACFFSLYIKDALMQLTLRGVCKAYNVAREM